MPEQADMDSLRKRIDNDAFAKLVGIEYEEVRGGYCRARMKIGPKHLNLFDAPHGGAVFTLADAVFAGSCNGYGEMAVAVSVTIDYMTPVRLGTVLVAEGTEISRTRKIGHYNLEIKNEAGDLVSRAKGTAYFLGKTVTEWENMRKEKGD